MLYSGRLGFSILGWIGSHVVGFGLARSCLGWLGQIAVVVVVVGGGLYIVVSVKQIIRFLSFVCPDHTVVSVFGEREKKIRRISCTAIDVTPQDVRAKPSNQPVHWRTRGNQVCPSSLVLLPGFHFKAGLR